MKIGLCAENTGSHKIIVLWTGLETEQLEEGAVLEIRLAGHWVKARLERDPHEGWYWRGLQSGWILLHMSTALISVRKEDQ